MITVLPVHSGGHGTPSPDTTATWVPSGDQRGAPDVKPGSNGWTSLPSAFAVYVTLSPRSGSKRAKAMRPFSPGTLAPAGATTGRPIRTVTTATTTTSVNRFMLFLLRAGMRGAPVGSAAAEAGVGQA